LNQNYPALEYIIIDGGSTDGSVGVIERYRQYLAYWVSEKDNGQSHAIRKGFDRATGKVLAWLNSDDVYLPGTLLRVGRAFMEASSIDLVYGNRYLIDENDVIIGERQLTPFVPYLSELGMLYGGFGIYQSASFWTRQVYSLVGELDEQFEHCMDNDLYVRFALAGAKFRFVREYLAGFRVHSTSKTSTLADIAAKERALIRSRYDHVSPLVARFSTPAIKALRLSCYVAQGDALYLLKMRFCNSIPWVP
jgi:glycosyltransferase involved in cell wall biosynthesis